MSNRDTHNPPGWDDNPSSWSQRLPIVVLALIGLVIAGYLTLYQYEIIDTVWEPFFCTLFPVDPIFRVTRLLTRKEILPRAGWKIPFFFTNMLHNVQHVCEKDK